MLQRTKTTYERLRYDPRFGSHEAHRYTFTYLGMFSDWYSLRAGTWRTKHRNKYDALELEGEVFDWLFKNVHHNDYILGNGNAPGYPLLPEALTTGNALIVRLRTLPDLLHFEQAFPVRGIKIEKLLAL